MSEPKSDSLIPPESPGDGIKVEVLAPDKMYIKTVSESIALLNRGKKFTIKIQDFSPETSSHARDPLIELLQTGIWLDPSSEPSENQNMPVYKFATRFMLSYKQVSFSPGSKKPNFISYNYPLQRIEKINTELETLGYRVQDIGGSADEGYSVFITNNSGDTYNLYLYRPEIMPAFYLSSPEKILAPTPTQQSEATEVNGKQEFTDAINAYVRIYQDVINVLYREAGFTPSFTSRVVLGDIFKFEQQV